MSNVQKGEDTVNSGPTHNTALTPSFQRHGFCQTLAPFLRPVVIVLPLSADCGAQRESENKKPHSPRAGASAEASGAGALGLESPADGISGRGGVGVKIRREADNQCMITGCCRGKRVKRAIRAVLQRQNRERCRLKRFCCSSLSVWLLGKRCGVARVERREPGAFGLPPRMQ